MGFRECPKCFRSSRVIEDDTFVIADIRRHSSRCTWRIHGRLRISARLTQLNPLVALLVTQKTRNRKDVLSKLNRFWHTVSPANNGTLILTAPLGRTDVPFGSPKYGNSK
jgi:hypothetical protein